MKHASGIFQRTATRATLAAIAAALGVGVFALWIYAHEPSEIAALAPPRVESVRADAKLDQLKRQRDEVASQLPGEQQRVTETNKTISQLEQLQKTWDLVSGNRAQQRANADRLKKNVDERAEAETRIAALNDELRRIDLERAAVERERDQLLAESTFPKGVKDAGPVFFLQRAWFRLRTWIFIGFALYMIGPLLGSLATKRPADPRLPLGSEAPFP